MLQTFPERKSLNRWQWETELTFSCKKWLFECLSERCYPSRMSANHVSSSRRDWNTCWLKSGSFDRRSRDALSLSEICAKALDWRSDRELNAFQIVKMSCSEWMKKYFWKVLSLEMSLWLIGISYFILCQHNTVSSRWGCCLRWLVSTHGCHLKVLFLIAINVPYT
jgi:hypothetical protein